MHRVIVKDSFENNFSHDKFPSITKVNNNQKMKQDKCKGKSMQSKNSKLKKLYNDKNNTSTYTIIYNYIYFDLIFLNFPKINNKNAEFE